MSTPTSLRQPLALRMTSRRVPGVLVPARLLPAVLDHGDELQGAGGLLRLQPARRGLRPRDACERQGALDPRHRGRPRGAVVHGAAGGPEAAGPRAALLSGGMDLARLDRRIAALRPRLHHRLLHRPAADPRYAERLHGTVRRSDHRTHHGALPGGVGGERVLPEFHQLPDRHHRRGHGLAHRRHPGRVRARALGLEHRFLAPDHRARVPRAPALGAGRRLPAGVHQLGGDPAAHPGRGGADALRQALGR